MVVSSMQHHPHHQQQGPVPPHLQHSRPSSIVHQQHHNQAPQQPPQHQSAYSSGHSVYQQPPQANNTQDHLPYYPHPSPYSTPGATSGYTSADTGDMMATSIRPPYPPMTSYHTPQSNSPASVASPSGHDQQRSIYGQAPSQLHQQSMYYGAPQHPQYSSMPAQTAPSPYAQHAQQSHQSIASQPSMMMSHTAPQHQTSHQATLNAQAGMATVSPRQGKIETQHGMNHQMQRNNAPVPLAGGAPSTTPQNGTTPTGSASGVNPNAAPGPIPATTPLVVRQDQNGVQWIAFEYSRDRVKMEYTIRCDVESVNQDELSPEFKTENCVYPRACCPKEQYRGNRLQYETECNTVGWALAQLNPPLRGKRGLIQRAVDSWRNSNQDPRLRSRRVRRMAKMNHRNKAGSATPHPAHMAGPTGPAGISTPAAMGSSGAAAINKPGINNMGTSMHHHHAHDNGNAQGGGDEVGDGEYGDDQQHHHHHHHQAPSQGSSDERPAQVFSNHGSYPNGAPYGSSAMPSIHDTLSGSPHASGAGPVTARRTTTPGHGTARDDEPEDLFPDIPEAKKRKFILVEDSDRHSRLRVRVTLDGVDTREIPDSFRKGASVYPRSYFPREMQSPPPSATGSKFFTDDLSDVEDDGTTDTEGRRAARGAKRSGRVMVKVPMGESQEGEIAIPRMRKAFRGKEVRLNDLGYRMAWLQSRVFAGRTVFLQRALDCYRNKTRTAIEGMMQDVKTAAPHYETRVGKRKWNERMRYGEKKEEES
ncbi:hypothetical protein QBC32DRAFT_208842 [Pseudoneurospora amorphoporcata]|uniref:DUF8032 domain-containing protein n=1 Tax=Pseudoneurospora amorphoporcata TaxID=241081 RepID=A0AAN6NXQ2_9PEZI|nr:hypothetical protein QBC32DRAFT_208842 [Pseudoneurospora amorphoporcata]